MQTRNGTNIGGMVLILLLGFGPLTGGADPEVATEESPETANEEILLFEEIPSVYAASKYEQKITDAPSSVSVVTAEEIRKNGYQTLAEILTSLQGIYATDDRNYGYLGIRGFLLPGDYNSRVLVMIDGHRVNESIYGSAGIQEDFVLDVGLIDRVEVVRGPNSSLYGTNAFFGVINIVTRSGRELQGAEVATGIGSDSAHLARLSYGRRLEGGVEFLASGTYAESDGKRRLFYPEYVGPGSDGVAVDADDEDVQRFFTKLGYQGLQIQRGIQPARQENPDRLLRHLFQHEPQSHDGPIRMVQPRL